MFTYGNEPSSPKDKESKKLDFESKTDLKAQ